MISEDEVLIMYRIESRSFGWQVDIIWSCRFDRGAVK